MHPNGIARLNIFFYGEIAMLFGAIVLFVRAARLSAGGCTGHLHFRLYHQRCQGAMNGAHKHP